MDEITCPNCGTAIPVEPDDQEPIRRQLSTLIDSGVSADETTDKVLADLPPSWASFFRPVVRREAHTIARDRNRQVEKATIGTTDRWEKAHADKRRILLAQRFSIGAGIEVTWGAATVDQHRLRVKLLDEQSSGIADTKRRHLLAVDLIEAAGATCLGDLDGSAAEAVLGDASAEVQVSPSVGARKPATSKNTARKGRRAA